MRFWITRDFETGDDIHECALWANKKPVKHSKEYMGSNGAICLYIEKPIIFEKFFGKLKAGECKELEIKIRQKETKQTR